MFCFCLETARCPAGAGSWDERRETFLGSLGVPFLLLGRELLAIFPHVPLGEAVVADRLALLIVLEPAVAPGVVLTAVLSSA